MKKFNEIRVCHGPTCGTHGAEQIMGALKNAYSKDGTEITERLCCGRCKYNNTIVVDGQTVSNLSPQNIQQTFISNPDETLEKAKEFEKNIVRDLDEILESDDILLM